MRGEQPWARHYLEEWQRRSGDRRLPYWLRVAALAYGSHEDNGHACFKRGEVALILGTPGDPYQNVKRAIEDAVIFGWLADGSFHRCLIVPRHAVRKGALEAGRKPCPIHSKRTRIPHQTWDSDELTDTRRGIQAPIPHQVSGSEREPLSSDLFPVSPDDPQAARLRLVDDERSA